MLSTTISVAFINAPRPGSKPGASWSIKTPEGEFYGLPPQMAGMVQQGRSYQVQYEDREFNGKMYHNIKSIVTTAQAGQIVQPAGQLVQFAPNQNPVGQPNQSPAVQPNQNNGAGHIPSRSNSPAPSYDKSEEIFVCALMGRAIQSGQININDLTGMKEAAVRFRLVFRAAVGPLPAPPQQTGQMPAADMGGDQIPF